MNGSGAGDNFAFRLDDLVADTDVLGWAGEFNFTLSITTDLTIGFNGKPAVSGLMWKPYHALSAAPAVVRETASKIPTMIPSLCIAGANVAQL